MYAITVCHDCLVNNFLHILIVWNLVLGKLYEHE